MDDIVLICLPFAGAGASFFRGWQNLAPANLQILPVQLPGREERFAEPLLTNAANATDEVYTQITAKLRKGDRVALFGHSLGAVLAYELAQRLRAADRVELVRLFVSGSPDPWSGRRDRATGLPDAEFVAQVQRFAGYTHPALEDEEMQKLLLPLLRADVELHEHYLPDGDHPLDIPITAIRGENDELVSASEAAQWSRATTADCDCREVPGGHMHLADAPDVLLTLIGSHLDQTRAR
ncbi:thioesterase II family protein [Streptomyces sp. NPDC087908]|uniref:thioesterase II family protein n=1 Tax=Streptomyces sp. NPDC087908 TaxID=3365820 RepID=UPI0037FC246F